MSPYYAVALALGIPSALFIAAHLLFARGNGVKVPPPPEQCAEFPPDENTPPWMRRLP